MVRAWFLLAAVTLVSAAGCNIFTGYLHRSEHFTFSTVAERDLANSLERTFANVKHMLREHNYTIRKAEIAGESAQVWAIKGGLEFVFDIERRGEGSNVRLEISQAGNGSVAFALIRELEMLP